MQCLNGVRKHSRSVAQCRGCTPSPAAYAAELLREVRAARPGLGVPLIFFPQILAPAEPITTY